MMEQRGKQNETNTVQICHFILNAIISGYRDHEEMIPIFGLDLDDTRQIEISY